MTARELRLIAEAASMAFLATRIYLTDFPIAFIMWSFIGAVFALTFFLSSLATACAAGAAKPVVVTAAECIPDEHIVSRKFQGYS